MKFPLDELKNATHAIVNANKDGEFNISTDTRTLKNGDIYLPLKGETFDGEKFCKNAIEAGAVGCFCTNDDCPADLTLKVTNSNCVNQLSLLT